MLLRVQGLLPKRLGQRLLAESLAGLPRVVFVQLGPPAGDGRWAAKAGGRHTPNTCEWGGTSRVELAGWNWQGGSARGWPNQRGRPGEPQSTTPAGCNSSANSQPGASPDLVLGGDAISGVHPWRRTGGGHQLLHGSAPSTNPCQQVTPQRIASTGQQGRGVTSFCANANADIL